jgi:hypothetical protein
MWVSFQMLTNPQFMKSQVLMMDTDCHKKSVKEKHIMKVNHMWCVSSDNGGRRQGLERRYFSYSIHIPERRSVHDNRSGKDRRSATGFKMIYGKEKRRCFQEGFNS